jgi:hypothetical protein
MPGTVKTVLTLALFWLAGVSAAEGQEVWEPGRYSSLKDESNHRLVEAEALEPGSPRRAALVLEAVRLRQEAAVMLRNALGAGVIAQTQSAPARAEYFALEASVTSRLLELSRCDEAARQLETAMSDPLLLPPGGLADLEALEGAAEACADAALFAREGPAAIGAANERIAVGARSAAEAQSEAALVLAARAEEAGGRDDDEPTVGGAEPAVETGAEPAVEMPARSSGRRTAAWVLVGAGTALGAGAIVYDVSLSPDRDELASLQDWCSVAVCPDAQVTRGRELSSDLDAARWIVGGLAVAGLVAGTVGLVLLFTSGDEPDSAPLEVALDGPGDLGANVRMRF